MKPKQQQATKFRRFMIAAFILVIIGICASFYFGLQTIRNYAIEVTHITEDANASGKQVEQLQALRNQLAQAQSLVQKADQIYATQANYQSVAISDLQRYAQVANVSIVDTDFTQGEQQAENTRRVTIGLESPVSYSNLTRFLQLVEGSMPKMQVQKLTVARPTTATGNQVTVDDIIINISVR